MIKLYQEQMESQRRELKRQSTGTDIENTDIDVDVDVDLGIDDIVNTEDFGVDSEDLSVEEPKEEVTEEPKEEVTEEPKEEKPKRGRKKKSE